VSCAQKGVDKAVLLRGCFARLCSTAGAFVSVALVSTVAYGGSGVGQSDVSPELRPLHCKVVFPHGAECSTSSTGIRLKLEFLVATATGRLERLTPSRNDHSGGATWLAETVCRSITTTFGRERTVARISGAHDCPEPVRFCVDVHAVGAGVSFPSSSLGLIRFKDLAVSVQGNSALGATVDAPRRQIRLCSDPKGQNVSSWTIEIRSGSFEEVKAALLAQKAPIADAEGRTIGYAKDAPVTKHGYIFLDLTEGNQGQLLPLIQQAGFPYALIYASTWAASKGSYAFNRATYPGGLGGLQRVVSAANQAGIKVGLHTLTGLISKNDAYVQGGAPDRRLLEDDHTTLWRAIDSSATTIEAADSLQTFPTRPAYYGNAKAGLDLRIEDEIISCPTIVVASRGRFQDCRRGLHGTKASSHPAGATIAHLAERYGSYLVDLSTNLKDEIGLRLAQIINQTGIDMVYFDGGEVASANGDPGWYVAEQQIAVLKRVQRPILVEGSGIVPRLWPFITRMATDDFAALAPVDYLDVHKIGRVHRAHRNTLIPDHLGWVAILKETPSYPATTPEEIATHIARSLALDIPIAIETHADDLRGNPYTEHLLAALGAGNQAIRSGVLARSDRDALSRGWWYFTKTNGPTLRRLRVAQLTVRNGHRPIEDAIRPIPEESAVWLRVRKVRSGSLAPEGRVELFDGGASGKLIAETMVSDNNRGELVESVPLGSPTRAPTGSAFVDFMEKVLPKAGGLDLRSAREMVVEYEYPAPDADPSDRTSVDCSVLNLQLEDNRGQYRDHLLRLGPGSRQQELLDYESAAPLVLRHYPPAGKSYAFKAAVYGFNFSAVTRLNIRWMDSCNRGRTLRLMRVAMVKEKPGALRNLKLQVGTRDYPVVAELRTGETLDVYPDGTVAVCYGAVCSRRLVDWPSDGSLSQAEVRVGVEGQASADIVVGLLGRGVSLGAQAVGRRQ